MNGLFKKADSEDCFYCGDSGKEINLSLLFLNKNQWMFELVGNLLKDGYTGKIEINCFQGGVSNVNKTESIKPQSERKG